MAKKKKKRPMHYTPPAELTKPARKGPRLSNVVAVVAGFMLMALGLAFLYNGNQDLTFRVEDLQIERVSHTMEELETKTYGFSVVTTAYSRLTTREGLVPFDIPWKGFDYEAFAAAVQPGDPVEIEYVEMGRAREVYRLTAGGRSYLDSSSIEQEVQRTGTRDALLGSLFVVLGILVLLFRVRVQPKPRRVGPR
ncbi:MAG: hypothetical protein GXX99_06040 [Clostridiales bacterium]|nr:hypothetical protein [Clostridiales bacterium]